MAKLFQHQADGTYYTTRYEDGVVARRIHPDGVVLLKRRGVRIGGNIPPFAMVDLVARNWLYAEEDAARHGTIDWAPDWNEIGDPPARSRDWLRGSTGWTRFEPASAMATAIEPHQDGLRWSTIAIGAVLLLMVVIAFLL